VIALLPVVRCDVTLDDGKSCDTEWTIPIGSVPAPVLRSYLHTLGWLSTRQGDVCPDCRAAGRRPGTTATDTTGDA